MKSLYNLKETAFDDTDCNATDCEGCEYLAEETCEGEPDTCPRVANWLESICDEVEREAKFGSEK